MVMIAIMVVFAIELRSMINHEKTIVKKNSLVKASNGETEEVNLSQFHISFAFVVSDLWATTRMDDPKYGYYSLH